MDTRSISQKMTLVASALAWTFASAAVAAPGRLPLEAVPERYALTLTPHLDSGTFDGAARIHLRVPKPTTTVTMNAAEYEVTRAEVAGAAATIKQDPASETVTLTFARPLAAGSAELQIAWRGKLSDKLSGFYHAEANGQHYAFSDFEPTDARRMFPCFDEPALKARFTMTAVIDAAHVAVSNAPVVSSSVDPATKLKTVRFAETRPLSTYLVALAVGPLVEVHATSGKVPIRVWTVPGKAHLGKYALDAAAELLPFYEKYFGVPYPYGKLDLVAVPDFEAGAMENAGAIFFRESALLVDEHGSIDHQRSVTNVIGHEMAHQWFGDLVTMQWWDDLWLNEAFATWAENRADSVVHADWSPWLAFHGGRDGALTVDAMKATHPIRMPVASPEQAHENFDSITYSKGAAVLRMIELWVGEPAFQKGVSEYLKEHAEKNATGEDLFRALAAASKKPVNEVAKNWFDQSGHPLVTAKASCVDGKMQLDLAQEPDARGGDTTWMIPLCTRTPAGTECALMTQKKETRVVATSCQPWVLANAAGGGFYRVRYDADSLRALGAAAEKSLTPEERAGLAADAWALARDGRLPLADYLQLASGYRGESRRDVASELARRLGRVGHDIVADPEQGSWRRFVDTLFGPTLAQLGWAPKANESAEARRLRAVAIEALGEAGVPSVLQGAERELARYLADPKSIDPSLAGAMLRLAARKGDAARFDTYVARMKAAPSPEEHDRFMNALTDFEAPVLVDRALALTITPDVRSQDVTRVVGQALRRPWSRRAAWKFVQAHLSEIQKRVPVFMMLRIVDATGSFCDADLAADLQRFWGGTKLPGLQRKLAQATEEAQRCVDLKTRERANVGRWLNQTSSGKSHGALQRRGVNLRAALMASASAK
ncbi:MAG: pepN 2 [Myxococcales bacterium]|nr:pepN 2 [Myxococcales bacterium]